MGGPITRKLEEFEEKLDRVQESEDRAMAEFNALRRSIWQEAEEVKIDLQAEFSDIGLGEVRRYDWKSKRPYPYDSDFMLNVVRAIDKLFPVLSDEDHPPCLDEMGATLHKSWNGYQVKAVHEKPKILGSDDIGWVFYVSRST